MWTVFARGTLLCLLVACGEPAAHVQLAPIPLANDCGKPAASTVSAVRVIAYTGGGELRRTDAEIGDFPADTEQLGVEVVGGTTVLATGKTAPLAYGELANGAQIPIAMVPPNGFCRAGDMHSPRAQPLVAHAGNGVLVVGGSPVSSAEYYEAGEWRPTLHPMAAVRSGHAAVGYDGCVVVFGGLGNGGPMSLVEVLNETTGDWSPAEPMTEQRVYLAAARAAGRLVVLGGWGMHGGMGAVETHELFYPPGVEELPPGALPVPARGRVLRGPVDIGAGGTYALYDASGRTVAQGRGPAFVTPAPGVYFLATPGALTRLTIVR